MTKQLELKSPLFTDWQEQHVKLAVPGITVGRPLVLSINGAPADFQFTGETRSAGAVVLLRIGLAKGETKVLEFFKIAETVGIGIEQACTESVIRYSRPDPFPTQCPLYQIDALAVLYQRKAVEKPRMVRSNGTRWGFGVRNQVTRSDRPPLQLISNSCPLNGRMIKD